MKKESTILQICYEPLVPQMESRFGAIMFGQMFQKFSKNQPEMGMRSALISEHL